MTFHASEQLVNLPFGGRTDIPKPTADSFGTYGAMDAVLLSHLNQLPDGDTIKEYIEYMTSNPSSPPTSSTLLSRPIIEVQLWGGLQRSDVGYVVSSLIAPDSRKVFGTQEGDALRSWAHQPEQIKPIRWALNASSTDYALDDGSSNAFQQVWQTAGSASPQEVYKALQDAGLLTVC